MIVVANPGDLRKAGAFLEALGKLERDFGFTVASAHTGDLADPDDSGPVRFGPPNAHDYGIVRTDHTPGSLALALIPKT